MQTAMQKARSVADKQITLSLIAVTNVLIHGRAMLEYQQRGEEHCIAQNPHYSRHHWSVQASWQLAEAVDEVVVDHVKGILSSAEFMALSCDETTDNSKVSQMTLHVYVVTEWQRRNLLISLAPTPMPANADNLRQHLISVLCKFTSLSEEQLASRLVAIGTDGAAVLAGKHNGMVVMLQCAFPFLLGFHCFAHRVDLAAKAIKDSGIVADVVNACNKIAVHYAHGGKRDDELHTCQKELGLRPCQILRAAETRWLSYKVVIERVHSNIPALLLHLHNEMEEDLLTSLTNVRIQLGMAALQPALQTLHKLVVSVQTEGGYIRDFVREVDDAIKQLHLLYCDEDSAWVGLPFSDWNGLKACLSSKKQKRDSSPLKFSKGPDMAGLEYDKPVLMRLIGEDRLYPLVAKHVPTATNRRPHRIPQHVEKEQVLLIVDEVKEQITTAIEGLVADLEDRFPRRDLLYAFEIISPEYWVQDSCDAPDDFDRMLDLLIDEFGVAKNRSDGKEVQPLIDGCKLRAQSSDFKSLALYFAPRVCDQADVPKSVTCRAERLACMWKALSKSPTADLKVGEFIKLAKLLLTVVSGSVADERVFSALEFVKCPRRNKLKQHLELCVRMKAQTMFDLKSFPFDKALVRWHENSARGRYLAT